VLRPRAKSPKLNAPSQRMPNKPGHVARHLGDPHAQVDLGGASTDSRLTRTSLSPTNWATSSRRSSAVAGSANAAAQDDAAVDRLDRDALAEAEPPDQLLDARERMIDLHGAAEQRFSPRRRRRSWWCRPCGRTRRRASPNAPARRLSRDRRRTPRPPGVRGARGGPGGSRGTASNRQRRYLGSSAATLLISMLDHASGASSPRTSSKRRYRDRAVDRTTVRQHMIMACFPPTPAAARSWHLS
jgi:hypothetical protein